jgi:hypothetical protein
MNRAQLGLKGGGGRKTVIAFGVSDGSGMDGPRGTSKPLR